MPGRSPRRARAFRRWRIARSTRFVHDKPLPRYLATTEFEGAIAIGKGALGRQGYAIVPPDDSAFREDLNRALLEYLDTAARDAPKTRCLGETT